MKKRDLAQDPDLAQDAALLAVALQRRRELQERCLRELQEHFGIEVPGEGIKEAETRGVGRKNPPSVSEGGCLL